MVEKASEQKEQLNALLEKYRGTKGSVIPVLQQAQEIYGYLPIEVQTMIADELHIPLEELKRNVKRVALFSNKRLNLVNFTFTHNLLTLNTQNSEHETAKAIINIDYPDETGHRESNLNYDYVREILNATDTDEVVFGFSPPYSNTQIRPKDEVNEMGVRVRYVVSHIMV